MERETKSKKKKKSLFEKIPFHRMSREQNAFQLSDDGDYLPLRRFLREPSRLALFFACSKKKKSISIWRNNQTIICLGDSSQEQYWERMLSFTIYCRDERKDSLHCTIFGKSDAAIAETATWFWSLKDNEGIRLRSYTENSDDSFQLDVSAFQPSQLTHILLANPKRELDLPTGVWNKEQAAALASCPLPIHLTIGDSCEEGGGFAFTDKGTAFVNALEKRQSPFGSLEIACDRSKPISRSNLERILKLHVLNKLQMHCLDKELALLPFSTKVNALSYTIDTKHVAPEDFAALAIIPKDLCLKIKVHLDDDTEEWEAILISLLNRVAALGHFERLTIALHIKYGEDDDDSENEFPAAPCVAQALIGAIRGNPKLEHLDVGQTVFHWSPHIDAIFGAMEDHKGLRTVIVGDYPRLNDLYGHTDSVDDSSQDDYSALERLLSRNRSITVLDCLNEKITNGTTVEKLYALNRFFSGSASLTKSAELRSLLFPTTLTEGASKNFQYTALLMSHHTDMLCEFIEDSNLGNVVAPDPIIEDPDLCDSSDPSSKRKVDNEPSPVAAKKADRGRS